MLPNSEVYNTFRYMFTSRILIVNLLHIVLFRTFCLDLVTIVKIDMEAIIGVVELFCKHRAFLSIRCESKPTSGLLLIDQ